MRFEKKKFFYSKAKANSRKLKNQKKKEIVKN